MSTVLKHPLSLSVEDRLELIEELWTALWPPRRPSLLLMRSGGSLRDVVGCMHAIRRRLNPGGRYEPGSPAKVRPLVSPGGGA